MKKNIFFWDHEGFEQHKNNKTERGRTLSRLQLINKIKNVVGISSFLSHDQHWDSPYCFPYIVSNSPLENLFLYAGSTMWWASPTVSQTTSLSALQWGKKKVKIGH